jgi:hypothetical protein
VRRPRAGIACLAVVALAALMLTGCARRTHVITTTSTVMTTTTETLSAPASPAPASYVPVAPTVPPGLPPQQKKVPAGETEKNCPYIANSDVASIEGDHVYRTVVLDTMTPVGCRFYFYAPPFEAIADIEPTTFANPTLAYNAMIATGEAGKGWLSAKDIIPGVDGMTYQTTFFGPDHGTDYACTFAKGSVLVTVHTQQDNVSFNAKALAAAIAAKF